MADERTDVELLRAAVRDDGAFVTLYERWAPELHAWFTRRTSSADTASELTAETFAEALHHEPGPEGLPCTEVELDGGRARVALRRLEATR